MVSILGAESGSAVRASTLWEGWRRVVWERKVSGLFAALTGQTSGVVGLMPVEFEG
jgi:hypothetical protein